MERTPLTSFLAPKYWPTWFGLGLLRLLSLLPMSVLSVVGQGLGLGFFYVVASRRRVVLRNLQSCFPEWSEEQRNAVTKQHFRLLGHSLMSTPAHMWMSRSRFNRLIDLQGREHYDAALAAGNNVILLAPHFVCLDVAGFVLSQERPMITMYQYAKNGLVDEIVKRGRTRYGGVLVERKEPMRNLIRLLRKGLPFYYLPDQDAGRKGVFVPFFNDLASTYSILGKFAQLSKAVVIPVRTAVNPWGQGYTVELKAPLTDFPTGDEVVDTSRMNQAIEEMIRQDPAQYFWVHKRFKTRPPNEVDTESKFYI